MIMETKIVLPRCTMENIPVIAGFVITTVEKDLVEIKEAAPDIDQEHLDELKAKNETVRAMVRPREVTGEMKEVTKKMYATMDSVKSKLNLLEIKINRVESQLKKSPDAFGLTKLRSQIRVRNAEGVLAGLELMLHEVDNNTVALAANGFTPVMREWFTTALNSINADNGLQNAKIGERGELTMENTVTISDFWKGISDLMRVGRLLYKDNPVKLKEYTYAVLHRRVEAAHKKDAAQVEKGTIPAVLSVPAATN